MTEDKTWRNEQDTCLSKAKYMSRKDARRAIKQLNSYTKTQSEFHLQAYKCPYCDFFHVGRRRYDTSNDNTIES